MTTASALHSSGPLAAAYTRAHAKMMRFLSIYHDQLIDSGLLVDLDTFITRVVTPAFGRVVDPNLFDHALIAYGCVQAVQDGTHEDLKRNPSGVVDNTLWLLDREQDYLDAEIRRLLNSIGVN